VKVDEITGAFTNIAPVSISVAPNGVAVDPENNRLLLLESLSNANHQTHMLTLDAKTGGEIDQLVLGAVMVDPEIAGNGRVIALEDGPRAKVLSVDPTTHAVATVATFQTQSLWFGENAIDRSNGIYYQESNPTDDQVDYHLAEVELATGRVWSVQLPGELWTLDVCSTCGADGGH
jgi:hypothetical protein